MVQPGQDSTPVAPVASEPFAGMAEPRPRFAGTEMLAAGLSVLWLAVVAGVFLTTDAGGTGLGIGLGLVAVVLPIAMIWIAALTARTAREMRGEAQRLQGSIEAMRMAWMSQVQASAARPAVETRITEIEAAQKRTEGQIATFQTRREPAAPAAPPPPAPPRARPAEEQPRLALGTPAEDLQPPVSTADFITALNFPDSPDDVEGFKALRRALGDRTMAKLIRAAQDVLTLLSQDGIFMDDLSPDRARPEVWRRFAQGERGRGIAALGGVRDRSSLALTAGRMRTDTIFRDASHHFLRQFDRSVQDFEKTASDQEMSDLAETRTARAFMLLGRVAGTFD
ncbi:hypothetical protein V8J36_00805 [Frigidibacter sp. MR17.14]|uniref:hypothetical protein n=1 Tax=Frigidibacter sp. MR17.14 TaxID=3126509 RepID=UPI003012CA22